VHIRTWAYTYRYIQWHSKTRRCVVQLFLFVYTYISFTFWILLITPSIHLSIYLFIYIFIYPSFYQSIIFSCISHSKCPNIYLLSYLLSSHPNLNILPFINYSIYTPIYLSVYLYIHLSFFLSICHFFHVLVTANAQTSIHFLIYYPHIQTLIFCRLLITPSTHLSIYLSIYISIYPSFYQSFIFFHVLVTAKAQISIYFLIYYPHI